MRYTNKHNLPKPFLRAAQQDEYDPGDSDYTQSESNNPPQMTLLVKRHKDEIVVDVSNMLYILDGKGLHYILDKYDEKNVLKEERFYGRVADRKISGQVDYLDSEGLLADYKRTSVWTRIYGSRLPDWEKQLNFYAYLVRGYGFRVEKLQIIADYRDWSKTNANKDSKYPQSKIEVIDIPLWDYKVQHNYIQGRIEVLKECEDMKDGELPPCTSEEMWIQRTKYALMKKGRETAVKVENSKEEILSFCEHKKIPIHFEGEKMDSLQHYIETRPGKRTRCEDYCLAQPFCHQFKVYKETQNKEVINE